MCGCVDTTQSNQSVTTPSCALQSSVFGCFCISLFDPHVISHTTLIFLPSTPFCSLILFIFSCNSKRYYFIRKEWMKIACILSVISKLPSFLGTTSLGFENLNVRNFWLQLLSSSALEILCLEGEMQNNFNCVKCCFWQSSSNSSTLSHSSFSF